MARGCLRIVAGLLVVGILLLLAWVVLALRQDHALQREIEELRQSGAPTSPTELNPREEGEGCNGAPVLLDALAAMEAYREEHRITNIHRPGQPVRQEGYARSGHNYLPADPRSMTPGEVGVARRVLRDLDGELTRLEEALGCPRMEFTLDWSPLHQPTFFFRSMGLPELGEVTGAANLLITRAALAVEREGDHDRAVGDLALALEVMRRMEARFGLAYLAQSTVLGGILHDLPHLLAVSGLDPATARRQLDPVLLQLDRECDPTRTLVGERAVTLDLYERMLLFGRAAPDQEALPGWWPRTALRADARAYMRIQESSLTLAHQPYHERQVRAQALRDEIDGLPFYCVIARSAGPYGLATCLGADHRRRVLRQARLGLAAALFRQSHDRWPREPAELEPLFPGEVPLDNPFTGEPFTFTVTEDSFAIGGPDQRSHEDPFRLPPAPPAGRR